MKEIAGWIQTWLLCIHSFCFILSLGFYTTVWVWFQTTNYVGTLNVKVSSSFILKYYKRKDYTEIVMKLCFLAVHLMALRKIFADSCTSYCHSFLSLSFCPFLITSGMISRVEAQRDHSAEDCRFLNFRKGEMITVYYKLTGKRNDLWAGSVSLLFSGSVLN